MRYERIPICTVLFYGFEDAGYERPHGDQDYQKRDEDEDANCGFDGRMRDGGSERVHGHRFRYILQQAHEEGPPRERDPILPAGTFAPVLKTVSQGMSGAM